jgi:GWxTD domain-containing protein
MRGTRRFTFAALLAAVAFAPGVASAQDGSRPLPPDWFDDDEWNLEVRYIITPEELARYKALTTVQARTDFIGAFWQRRDPSPGTAVNEFRDEFMRRVEYANAHFADPNDAPHPGVESDRGRIYVVFGPPEKVEPWPGGAHEVWRYSDRDQKFVFAFSVPPVSSCDGSYRIWSPAPIALARGAFTSVQVFPRRFVTVSLTVDFSLTASVAHTLEKPDGEQVPFEEGAMLSAGQIGPAGSDPLSQHLLGCRMFEPNGMGFTQPLPPGSYTMSSRIVLLGGAVREDKVAFEVR